MHAPAVTSRRVLARCCLLAVPALALVAAGPALSSAFSGGSAEHVSANLGSEGSTLTAGDAQANDASNIWQNTLRVPYVPPTRSPYVPPGP